jgi:hypothetical protein
MKQPKDKRTKAYKEWIFIKQSEESFDAKPSEGLTINLSDEEIHALKNSRSEGLGDTVEKIFEKTGVKKAVEWLANGKDCGCAKRKAYLNEKYRYKVGCMVESEYIWWSEYMKRLPAQRSKEQIPGTDVFEISRLYIRLFRLKPAIPCCKAGYLRVIDIIDHINKVYETYK